MKTSKHIHGFVTAVLVLGVCVLSAVAGGAGSAPQSTQNIEPLIPGDKVPGVTLHTAKGDVFDLQAALAEKPAVIIFYRGGWCPYCNRHLADLQKAESQLIGIGYQILAISPDRLAKLKESIGKGDLTYTVLSDSSMTRRGTCRCSNPDSIGTSVPQHRINSGERP